MPTDVASHFSSLAFAFSPVVFLFFAAGLYSDIKRSQKKNQTHRRKERAKPRTPHLHFYTHTHFRYINYGCSSDRKDRSQVKHLISFLLACRGTLKYVASLKNVLNARFRRMLSGNRFPFWKQVKTIYADRDKSPWNGARGLFRFSQKKEREEAYEKQASSHPLPWAPHPTCVSKWREQTPKINRWSQTRFFTSFLIPLEKHKEKGKRVCVQCVGRPGVCMCMCRALVKCLRFMLDIPHGVKSPGRAGAGSVTRQRAWTAQSLIRTTPCTRGGSGRAQCLGILL